MPLLEFFWTHMIKQSQSKLGEVLFRRIGVESVNNQLVLLYHDSMYFFESFVVQILARD